MSILDGVDKFQKSVFPEMKEHFAKLAGGQSPHALFITCSDSRIDPYLLTQTRPGELFVIRNAGNIIPDPEDQSEGVLASIEYAVSVLNVPEIIVCGHSNCGAMGGLLALETLESLPLVHTWLGQAKPALDELGDDKNAEDAAWKVTLLNVSLQLKRLRQLPFVDAKVSEGKLALSGWCYQFEKGNVFVLNEETNQFDALLSEPSNA